MNEALAQVVLLEELVRWLALPYDGREPTFAGADGLGTPDGRPLPLAAALRALYREVVRD